MIAESATLSTWFSAAAPCPETAVSYWAANPRLPRRLHCGVTFDIVLADRNLVEEAYRLLNQYAQPTGPAMLFTNLRCAAVMVPVGTVHRWNGLMSNSSWPERTSRPWCLGRDNMIRIPAPQPSGLVARWLVAPDDDQAIGGAPLLTSPPPLARCLTEARSLLEPPAMPAARTPLRRAVSVVRSVLPAPQRT